MSPTRPPLFPYHEHRRLRARDVMGKAGPESWILDGNKRIAGPYFELAEAKDDIVLRAAPPLTKREHAAIQKLMKALSRQGLSPEFEMESVSGGSQGIEGKIAIKLDPSLVWGFDVHNIEDFKARIGPSIVDAGVGKHLFSKISMRKSRKKIELLLGTPRRKLFKYPYYNELNLERPSKNPTSKTRVKRRIQTVAKRNPVSEALGRPLTDAQLQRALQAGRIGVIREEGHTLYSAGLVKFDRPAITGRFYYALPSAKKKLELGKVLVARNKVDAAARLGVPKKTILREAGYKRDDWKGRGYSEEDFLTIFRTHDPRSVIDGLDTYIGRYGKKNHFDTVILRREPSGHGVLATEVIDLRRVKMMHVVNPKKKAKKKAVRKKGPTALSLIGNCQRKWEGYRVRPSKKRLKDIYVHLEKMKESTSKKVADERRRCLRAANLEKKRLGMKS